MGFPYWNYYPAKCSGHKSCEGGNMIFLISHVTLDSSRNQRVKWPLGWETLTVCHHLGLSRYLTTMVYCKWGCNVINLSNDLTRPGDERVMFMWLYGWELVELCHHPGKPSDHRHLDSKTLFSVSLHICTCLNDHITLWVGASCFKSLPCYVWWLQTSVETTFLICLMIS